MKRADFQATFAREKANGLTIELFNQDGTVAGWEDDPIGKYVKLVAGAEETYRVKHGVGYEVRTGADHKSDCTLYCYDPDTGERRDDLYTYIACDLLEFTGDGFPDSDDEVLTEVLSSAEIAGIDALYDYMDADHDGKLCTYVTYVTSSTLVASCFGETIYTRIRLFI